MKKYIRSSSETIEMDATDVVRDLYHKFPDELDFYEERSLDDDIVVLYYQITRGTSPKKLDEIEEVLKSYGVKHQYKGPYVRIFVKEAEEYK